MSFWPSYLTFVGFVLGGSVVATVVQEAGHLLSAKAASIPLRRMVIGWGPVLLRGRVAGIRVELRLVVFGGWVVCAESAKMPTRGAVALYLVGGVLGNIAIIAVAIWLHIMGAWPTVPDKLLVLAPVGALVATQLLFIVVGLLGPFGYAALPDNKRYREGTTRPPIGFGSWASVRIEMHLARSDRRTSRGRRRTWAALRRELAQGDLPPEREMLALDWLVTDALTGPADPLLRPELDQWSHRALQLGPKVKTLVASRGAVLVELGRHREGKALLETVAFAAGALATDALLIRMFLARAEQALGNAAAADHLITEARMIAHHMHGPERAAWITGIQREALRLRSPHRRVRRAFGRRTLKGAKRLSLPRPRARLRLPSYQ